jgi:galactokinase/mevalonate kinase-like predicted kinase
MTFLVDPSRRGEVIRALSKQAGRIMTCTFTGQGAESWKIL